MNFVRASCILLIYFQQPIIAQHYISEIMDEVGIWNKFELSFQNSKSYQNPFTDVELKIKLQSPEGREIDFWGFYDDDQIWKVRFSPDELGKWQYKIWFDDDNANLTEGTFICVPSKIPGQVNKYTYNPFWLGYKSGHEELFRSFHVGDRFFAQNWDDPLNPNDGEKRTEFLNWFQKQGYNMISVASHYLNRQEKDRGLGWETPKLWPLNEHEYGKMEAVLDTLAARGIIVFPFAGFFGAKGDWPTNTEEQRLFVKYTLARIGFYWNIILNVAGPEPFWRKNHDQYQGNMRWNDINRLGNLISILDVHGHILTLHNEKRATQYGDPFLHQDWYSMNTLQGPTTLDRERLFSGLIMNHHTSKPLYAQETLWYGNKWHPEYSDEDLRKNAFTILFAGGIMNFADMNGNSSTGFSGEIDFRQLHLEKHRIVHQVWDFFESIPFYKMRTTQDLVKNGFCLAKEGEEYYIYLDSIGQTELFVDFGYPFSSEWINAQNTEEKIDGPTFEVESIFQTPAHGEDWILHAYANKPEQVSSGNFPDLTLDKYGNIHIVYNRAGLKYKKYDITEGEWSEEQSPGCDCDNVKRSDPDIVVDSHGNPLVFCGKQAARWDGANWIICDPEVIRDTELAIDSHDNIYLSHRGGNNGGFIGLKMLPAGKTKWIALTDPDKNHAGPNDHVYVDLWIDDEDNIHMVQRHGPVVEVTYRMSSDGGNSWNIEDHISNERSEAPHIVVDHNGNKYISTGKGYIFESYGDRWKADGRRVTSHSRHQPELGVDGQNNIYLTSFGGHINIKNAAAWAGEFKLDIQSEEERIGFVETTGAEDFAYIIWEEGFGNPDEGLHMDSRIYLAKLFPDGRIVGLGK